MQHSTDFSGSLAAKYQPPAGPGLGWHLRNCLRFSFVFGALAYVLARAFTRITGIPTLCGSLHVQTVDRAGRVINYGVVGYRVVTSAWVDLLVDELQGAVATFNDFKYHASGTDNTAEAAGDTALGAEVEDRVSGTQAEGAANIYESEATVTYTQARAIVEHGLFNADEDGVLMDRTVFTVINVENQGQITFTYQLTANAGS